ncbi:hypothetical protein OROGR_026299 [Orobanche gracilis]
MSFHLKGVKKSTMMDEMRRSSIEYHKKIQVSPKHIGKFGENDVQLISQPINVFEHYQAIISFFGPQIEKGVKRHKSAKFSKLEKVLYEWFVQYQERINMTGELITEKMIS